MECERCHQRPATVYLTEIINDNKRTMHLCEQCAREVQAESMGFLPQLNLHSLLASIFNNEFSSGTLGQTLTSGRIRCATCGITESQFAKQGLLGCGDCYRYFGDRLESILRRIHGTTRHTGKVPQTTGGKLRISNKIERLKMQLKEAVNREEFERAAQLRDQIRELERELKERGK